MNQPGPGEVQVDTSGEPPPEVEIQVTDLHMSFDGHKVLLGIDLAVNRGDVIAIVGGSGSGKTVLLNNMLSLLTPVKGRVLVTNHELPGDPLVDLARLEPGEMDQIRTHWGVVFQRNALFSGTVYDNIALWLREVKNLKDDEIRPIARSALVSVGLESNDEFFDQEVSGLSGGMAKRLAVARALAMNPIVLFYDEPTTGLDPVSASQIHDLIIDTHFEKPPAPQNRTTVIITHDKDLLVRLRPRVVMLHDGLVYFDGSLEEFEKSESPVIRPYFERMPVLHQRFILPS